MQKIFILNNIQYLLLGIILQFLLVACSSKNTILLDEQFDEIEKKEILYQKKILIKEMSEASKKLHKITWPILKNNYAECKKNRSLSYGILFAAIDDLPLEDHKIYFELYNKTIKKSYFTNYNVDSFPIILSVADNSPAKAAGLKKNDIVLQVNNKNTKNFRANLHYIFSNKSNLFLTILRENKIIKKELDGIKACSYNVQPIPSGSPNAFADGTKVFITIAAIKLAKTEDEIAFLIGHEIAHNIKHFKSFSTSEANTVGIDYLDKPKVREFKNLFIWANEEKEIEADIEGVKLAFNAGYSLDNVNDYWRRLSVFNPELISKSPNIYKGNAFRAALINKTIEKLRKKSNEK